MYRRSTLVLLGLYIFQLPALAETIAIQQETLVLPDSIERDLQVNFFMIPALELLQVHRTQAGARLFLDNSTEDIQFTGSQVLEDEVSLGYVSQVPERIVSVTVFFDRDSDSITLVHVLISPGMRSRALRLIDASYSTNVFADHTGTGQVHLLGIHDLDGVGIQITLREQESDLGPLLSINYSFSN